MKNENKHLVFTYGTLMRGYGNNRLLKDGKAEFVGTATTFRSFVMYNVGFPYAVEPKDAPQGHAYMAGKFYGEVWKVNDTTLANLDRLEGVPHHYKRDLVRVGIPNKGLVTFASMYVCNTRNSRISPDWEPVKFTYPDCQMLVWSHRVPLSQPSYQRD